MSIINHFLAFIFVLSSLSGQAATWKKLNQPAAMTAVTPAVTTCPANYIGVPAQPPYTFRYFCVMKYEAKNDGYGTAASVAAGTPWGNIPRTTNTPATAASSARTACQALGAGFDLISNEQWQTIARNIAGVASNWSTGTVGSGELNRGHSDSSPFGSLAASTDDVNGNCSGTGQTCSSTVWDSQRRTHTLSNGNVIWDFSGNFWEWVTNDNNVSNGADGYISTISGGNIRQTRYGSSVFCASPSSTPYCGMGNGTFASGGAVYRGGNWAGDVSTGLFAVALGADPSATGATIGFRCVFVP